MSWLTDSHVHSSWSLRDRLGQDLRLDIAGLLAEIACQKRGEFRAGEETRERAVHQEPQRRIAALHRNAIGLAGEETAADDEPGGIARLVEQSDEQGAVAEIGVDRAGFERRQPFRMGGEADDIGAISFGLDGPSQDSLRRRPGADADTAPRKWPQLRGAGTADDTLVQEQLAHVPRRIRPE